MMINYENDEILIIDDIAENIKIIRNILLTASYKTLIATNGLKGIEIARTKQPALILLDIMMPDIDGYETCRILKTDELTRNIPVIFISALNKTFDKVKAFNFGGVDYVSKPIQEEELLARINTHIKIKKIEKQLITLNSELSDKNSELTQTLDNLKKTQALLIQSEKMTSLGILTAGIAHEINNPINYINVGCKNLTKDYNVLGTFIKKLIQNDFFNAEIREKFFSENNKDEIAEIQNTIKETITDISSGTDRIIEIIKSLNIFLYNDKQIKTDTDVNSLIDTALVLLKNKYKYSIQIKKEYSSEPLSLKCFPGQLNQVFVNIINNAIDAINGVGEIFIKTEFNNQNNQIIVYIRDNGSGIPEDVKKYIFDPFFTTKDIGKGMGLGLFLTYEIVKKHSGEIIVESKQNEFTEFKIILPV